MLDQYRGAISHLSTQSPMLDLALHHHRVDGGVSGQGLALTFQDMPFLVQLYRDLPYIRDMCAMKCTQVGWTEALLVFMVMQALRDRRLVYVLPDDDLARTFVQSRVQPMIARVPHYAAEQAATVEPGGENRARNMRLRFFAGGSWRFIGSQKPAKFREFAVHAAIVDEYDDCLPDHLGQLDDRVLVAKEKGEDQMFRVGNPKRTTGGISSVYENSDQRHWFQKCTRCGHWQQLDWFRHFVRRGAGNRWEPRDRERAASLTRMTPSPGRGQDIRPQCERCDGFWDRVAAGARWVITNPGYLRRGYHVSQMDHLGRPMWGMYLKWMAAQNDPHLLSLFYGNNLGIAYKPQGSRLTTEALRACYHPSRVMDHEGGARFKRVRVVAGIDVGAVLNVTISVVQRRKVDPSDKSPGAETYVCRRAIWVGAVPNWEDLGDLLKRYHVRVAVIDAEPEHHKAQEFRAWATRKLRRTLVWLCYYHPNDKTSDLPFGMRIDKNERRVIVDKTQAMDATNADILNHRREWPSDMPLVLAFEQHMCTPVRVLRSSGPRAGRGYTWDRGNDRDDYRQAEVYEAVAAKLLRFAPGYLELPA